MKKLLLIPIFLIALIDLSASEKPVLSVNWIISNLITLESHGDDDLSFALSDVYRLTQSEELAGFDFDFQGIETLDEDLLISKIELEGLDKSGEYVYLLVPSREKMLKIAIDSKLSTIFGHRKVWLNFIKPDSHRKMIVSKVDLKMHDPSSARDSKKKGFKRMCSDPAVEIIDIQNKCNRREKCTIM